MSEIYANDSFSQEYNTVSFDLKISDINKLLDTFAKKKSVANYGIKMSTETNSRRVSHDLSK